MVGSNWCLVLRVNLHVKSYELLLRRRPPAPTMRRLMTTINYLLPFFRLHNGAVSPLHPDRIASPYPLLTEEDTVLAYP
jgi:hypothetical protein